MCLWTMAGRWNRAHRAGLEFSKLVLLDWLRKHIICAAHSQLIASKGDLTLTGVAFSSLCQLNLIVLVCVTQKES